MPFLPIIDRELRLAARKPGTYWFRFGVALILAAICLAMIAVAGGVQPARLAANMFQVLKYMAFAYCLLVGVRYAADCLSEEKRGGTLGLLFLTDLRAYDVVLGKMVVSSIHAVYGLMAAFPLLCLPLLFGGITGGEFWRTVLVLLNTAFFSLALGTLVSALGREERQVALVTFLILLVLNALFPAFKLANMWDIPLFHWLVLPTPAYALQRASFLTPAGAADFWLSMRLVFGLGILFIVLACVILPRIFQEKGRLSGSSGRMYRWRFGLASRSKGKEELLWANPFHWLVTRDRLWSFYPWLLTAGLILFTAWIAWAFHREPAGYQPVVIFGTYGAHAILKFLIVSGACHRLNEDRRNGALELLLSTPVSPRSIVRGQFVALMQAFWKPALVLAVLNIVCIIGINEKEPGWVLLGGIVLLGIDALALSWAGMLQAVQSPKFSRAVFRTIARVMGPPWVIMSLFFFAASTRPMSNSAAESFFLLWFLASFAYSFLWMTWSRTQLTRNFRALASGQPELNQAPNRQRMVFAAGFSFQPPTLKN